MLERAVLREQSERLLDGARRAAETYAGLADASAEPTVREQLQKLSRDKQRHMRLAERLLEILQ